MDSEDFSKTIIQIWLYSFDTELAEYSSKDFEESSYSEEEYMASNNVSANKMLILQGSEGLLDETHTTKYGVTKIYNFYVKLILLIMYD